MFILSFWVVLEHFKVYITITDAVGQKRIDLAYLIRNLDQSKEVAIVSMFSDNIQNWIKEPLKKILLIMNEKKLLPEWVFTDRELNASTERKLINNPLDDNDNIITTGKLAYIAEMVFSLDEIDNTNNLEEDRRLSSVLLRYHVTGFEELTSFESVTPQYKRLKNREFTSLTLRTQEKSLNFNLLP